MLKNLSVKNLAIIEDVSIDFHQRLNIITGETGAGKSIIIKSLDLIMGERGDADFIRKGSATAEITATLFFKGKEIKAKRILQEKGSKCFLDDKLVSVAQLKEVIAPIINICSQHEYKNISIKETQLNLLDSYLSLKEEVSSIESIFKTLTEKKEKLKELEKEGKIKEERLSYLEYQLGELKNIKISETEYLEMEEKALKLSEKVNLGEKIKLTETILFGEEGALSLLEKLTRELGKLKSFDWGEKIRNNVNEIEKVGLEILKENNDLEKLISSVEAFNDLKSKVKKHGGSISNLLEKKVKIEKEIEFYRNLDLNIQDLKKELKKIEKQYLEKADILHKKREKGALVLEKKISEEMRSLNMKNALMQILLQKGEYLSTGYSHITFLLAPNEGEGLKPMDKIASGGELSRILLSLHKIINQDISTFVFDEVDSGIGGNTAHKIGIKLHELALNKQVIAITHLAQVAVYGDNNYFISKDTKNKRTTSHVIPLEENSLVKEISRMIGGENKASLDHSKALIQEARKNKSFKS